MSEVRLIDANALKYKNLAEVNGRLTYVLTAEEINNAPTVESDYEWGYSEGVHDTERPQGKWRVYEGVITCEKCGKETEKITPFCAWCGAEMKGGTE